MRSALKVTSMIGMIASTAALSCGSSNPSDGFLPENNLSIPIDAKTKGLSEAQYNEVINKVEKIYSPIVQEYGLELKISRKWSSPTVNAGTYRDEYGTYLHINLYGGMARHSEMTKDGYTLVICHELGHHMGGFPKKVSSSAPWSSAEGQADYFATLKCLRTIFASDNNEAIISSLAVPEKIKERCEKQFVDKDQAFICQRSVMAGLSVAAVNAATFNYVYPSVDSFDSSAVSFTLMGYTKPQCRFDTYLEGSMCEVDSKEVVSDKNEIQGTCHPITGHVIGVRPSCWFRPKLSRN